VGVRQDGQEVLSPTCFGFDFWRSRWKWLSMEWFFATSRSEPAMTRASLAAS
jgi:hypothetical protein